jgi:FKBP-type peptidyl-prolyl cis-trans isomerase 2
VRFTILSASGAITKVRLLHPLVGRDIEYRVKVLAVRQSDAAGNRPPPVPGMVELDPDEMSES